jgi:hypothetical protein
LEAEVGALREAVAKAERDAQERGAAAAAMQAELEALRETLAQTEREAQNRVAAQAALQAEIARLQETITSARQVGKAAIAALRSEAAAPKKLDRPRGWRPAVMRLFGARASA